MSVIDSNSLNLWSLLYTVTAWLVVLGVVLEGFEIFSRRLAKRKKRNFIGPVQNSESEPVTPDWVHALGDTGFVILFVALAFEQMAHQKIESIMGRERDRLTKELGAATAMAAAANERAEDAKKETGKSEFNRLELEKQVVQLKIRQNETEIQLKDSERARAQAVEAASIAVSAASSATNSAGSASNLVIKANMLLEQAKSSVSLPRHITGDQRKQFWQLIKAAPKGEVGFMRESQSPEAISYANELRVLIVESGYPSTGPMGFAIPPNAPLHKGIVLSVASPEHPPIHAIPLINALKQIGVTLSTEQSSHVNDTSVMIFIWDQ